MSKNQQAFTFFEEMLSIIGDERYHFPDNLENFLEINTFIGLEVDDYNKYHKNYVAGFAKLRGLINEIGNSSLSAIKGLINLLEERSRNYGIPLQQLGRGEYVQLMKTAVQKLPNISQGLAGLYYGSLSSSDKREIGLYVFFQLRLLERKNKNRNRQRQRQIQKQKLETARRQTERRNAALDRQYEKLRQELGPAWIGGFSRVKSREAGLRPNLATGERRSNAGLRPPMAPVRQPPAQRPSVRRPSVRPPPPPSIRPPPSVRPPPVQRPPVAPVRQRQPLPGDLVFVRKLGQGGYGQTSVVRSGSRSYVMKRMHNNTQVGRRNIQVQYNMLSEVNRRLQGNPRYVRPVHININTPQPYFLMEYDEGFISLQEVFNRRIDLSRECRNKLGKQIVRAVRRLHRVDIVHRDIKPDNVIINPVTCEAKIIDFGLATTRYDGTRGIAGTPEYFGPRIYRNTTGQYTFDDFVQNDIWGAKLIESMLMDPNYTNRVMAALGNVRTRDERIRGLRQLFNQHTQAYWNNELSKIIRTPLYIPQQQRGGAASQPSR